MIQIIDGFKVNSINPVDSRFVVADAVERDGITYKYHGLRVWQLDTNTPYFWDGVNWKSELDLVVTGTGSSDFIPKVTNSNPLQINDSQISDDGNTVSIINDLSVGNDITFSGNLNGQLNADNITSGNLDLSRLQTGSSGDVLQMGSTTPSWVSLSSISIGSSTNTENVKVIQTISSNEYKLILRESTSLLGVNLPLYSYNSGLLFSDSSGSMCILAHNGSPSDPPYSFDSSPGTGMYSPGSNKIGFSVGDAEKVRIDTNGFKTIDGNVGKPSMSFINDDDTGMYRPGSNQIGFSAGGVEKVRIGTSFIYFYDRTSFFFSDTNDYLYIQDIFNRPFDNAILRVRNTTSKTGIIVAEFSSGSGKIQFVSNNTEGGYAGGASVGSALITAQNNEKTIGIGVRDSYDGRGVIWNKEGYVCWGEVSSDTARTNNTRLWINSDDTNGEHVARLGINSGNSLKIDGSGTIIFDTNKTKVIDPDFFSGKFKVRITTGAAYAINDEDFDWSTSNWRTVNSGDSPTTSDYLPSKEYDRMVFAHWKSALGGAEAADIRFFIEKVAGSGNMIMVSDFSRNLTNGNPKATISALIPAGCRWAFYAKGKRVGGIDPEGIITIYKFGIR